MPGVNSLGGACRIGSSGTGRSRISWAFLFVIFVWVVGNGASMIVIQRELDFVIVFLSSLVLGGGGVKQCHVLTFEEENEFVELWIWVILGV